jgi:hypothetical protein
MLIVVAKQDQSINVPHDSIEVDSVAGDPLGQAKFTITDEDRNINLQCQQEIIIFDETVALTPSGAVSAPFNDTFATNDLSSSYTSTHGPGGSTATWTYHAGSVTFTKVQSNMLASSGATTSQAATLGVGVTSGNLLVAAVSTGANNTTVTPPTGWSLAVQNNPTSGTNNDNTGLWWAIVGSGGVTAGTTSFTFNFGSSHNVYIELMEVNSSTGWQASPVDVTAVGNVAGGTGTALTSGTTSTTSQAYELWFATFAYTAGPQTESGLTAGWTRDNEVHDGSNNHTAAAFYQFASSTGAASCGFSIGTTEFWAGAIATFKPVAPTPANVTASGGLLALLTVNNWSAQNMTVGATMTISDEGGVAFNIVDANNYYELVIHDSAAPGSVVTYDARGINSTLVYNGSLQLYKILAGVRTAIGPSRAIYFPRGTSHSCSVSTSNNGTSTIISVAFDSAQLYTYTDASSPLGVGTAGLRNDTVSGASSALYTAFSATSNDIPTLVTSVPTHNYARNNSFTFGGSGWGTNGSLSGLVTFPSNPTFGAGAHISITFSNSVLGDALADQFALKGYLVIGQTYCLSASFVATGLVNAQTELVLGCLDKNGADITNSPQVANGGNGTYRMSVFFTPTDATGVSLYYEVGANTTTGGSNAGTVTVTSVQIEPVWFASGNANKFNTTYPTPICDFLQSDCVTLPDGTASRYDRVFTGFITHLTLSYTGITRIWDVECTAADTLLETSALVNASYANVTDLSIIQGIVNSLPNSPLFAASSTLASGTPAALAYRNVPVCVAGVVIASIQFADNSIREVLNSLTDITGFTFGVDQYYNVFYYPPFYSQAPYAMSSQPNNVNSFIYYDYSIEYDGTQLHNAVRVIGTTYSTTVVEAWHIGDGSHSEVVSGGDTNVKLFHAPNATPTAITSPGAQTIAEDTGSGFGSATVLVNWNNTNTTTSWGIGNVRFNTTLANGTAVSVTYAYDTLAYVAVQSPDSVAQYGRALYFKINDTNLGSNASCVARGEAELQAYAQPRVTLKFKTQKLLAVGQVVIFTSHLDSIIAAHYLIQKVTATFLGTDEFDQIVNQYEVEAGVYVDDFIDFFRNTQKAINRVDHDPAAPIQQTNNLQQDSLSISDSLVIHT